MIFWAVTTERSRQEPFCYHWTYCINTRVYLCLFCRLYLSIHVYIILDIDKQRTAPQIAGLTASELNGQNEPGTEDKKKGDKKMTESMKAMAQAMANKTKMVRIFADSYENKRECPFYSELKGMELALKAMNIEYDFEYDEETYMITAVTVMGQRVAVE